ncbi:MAG: recombinase family protein [Cyanobacteria bacterium J06649_11]
MVVARILNESGYRTRKGAKFTAWTIERHLTDPIAKGMRRANYTKSKGKNQRWELKPEEEWVFVPAPAIVSEELWEEVNQILRSQKKKTSRPKRGVINLFAGLVYCACGTKMYVQTKTEKYICSNCRNKIPKDDLEFVFQQQLQTYTVSGEQIQAELEKATAGIASKERLLKTLQFKEKEVTQEVRSVLKLISKGQFPEDEFNKFYNPLAEQLKQIEAQIPEVKAKIDFLKTEKLSSDKVLQEAQSLYSRWPLLTFEEKRSIVETIVTKLTVGKDDLEIDLAYLVPSSELITKASHNPKDSSRPPS